MKEQQYWRYHDNDNNRARRLAKKLKKEAQREAENKLFDYSNNNNPFRDKNLTKMFIWKKKFEKEIKQVCMTKCALWNELMMIIIAMIGEAMMIVDKNKDDNDGNIDDIQDDAINQIRARIRVS